MFLSIETYLAGEISIQKNFDRDNNLKIFLLPGLEAQKVEKHWLNALKLAKTLSIVGRGNFFFKYTGRGAIWVENHCSITDKVAKTRPSNINFCGPLSFLKKLKEINAQLLKIVRSRAFLIK